MSYASVFAHPFLPILGYRKNGTPIYPIMGAEDPPEGGQQGDNGQQNQQQQNTGPEMVKDEQGNDLFPKNTAVAEMKPEHREAYWRTESKKQQKLREDAERKLQQQNSSGQNGQQSGTVRDQQGTQTDDAADKAREEGRREGQRDAVVVSMTSALQFRGKTADEITELLDVVNPDKFLGTDGKVDTTKVANYISRVAPATNGGGGSGGAPGQGRFENNTKTDPREIAREEAKKRGYLDPGANRGALGGLRK